MTSVPCTEDGCDRKHYARGYCNPHYVKFRKEGVFVVENAKLCSSPGCTAIHHAKGFCSSHYDQNRWPEIKDKKTEYLKQWRRDNPEAWKALTLKWREANREHLRDNARAYAKATPEVGLRARDKRRARKLNVLSESFTTQDIIDLYGTDCHLCGEPVDLEASRRVGSPGWEKSLHRDHYIPLAKGGTHTLGNMRPSHGLCNVVKGARSDQ